MIIKIDMQSDQPIYEQLCRQIIFGIAAGWIQPGEALPSARRLAADLGINLHTVGKAYALLTEEGYLAADRHKGTVAALKIEGGALFLKELDRLMSLCAAKAICSHMEEDTFIKRCTDCFRQVKGGSSACQ